MELKRYFEIIWRRKWVLLEVVGVIVGAGLLACYLMTPIYGVSSKVLINVANLQPDYFSQPPSFQLPMNIGKLSYVESRNVIDTYITLAKSSSVMARVIEELNLVDDEGNKLEVEDFVVTLTRLPGFIVLQKKGVKIKRLQAAEVLGITGYSTDQEEAANIANGVAQSFLAFLSELHKEEASAARQSIEKKLIEIGRKKEQAEEAEAQFRIKETIVNLDNQLRTLIDELSALETRKDSTQRAINEAYSELATIRSILKERASHYQHDEILSSSTALDNYKNQLAGLEIQLAGLLAEYTPESLEAERTKEQIEVVKKAIKSEISKLFGLETTSYYNVMIDKYATAEINIVTLKAGLEVLADQVDKKKGQLSEIPRKSKELARLTSETQNLSDMYTFLKRRLEYVKTAEAMDIANAATIQLAIASADPDNDIYFPKKVLVMTVSGFMAAFFGLLLCFLVDYLDDRIRTAQDISERINQPVLGVIPKTSRRSLEDRTTKKGAAFYGNFWDLRSNIKMVASDNSKKILSITSTVKGEGKSTIAKNLAQTLAEAGQKVLLLDLNFRRPRLHRMFRVSNPFGLIHFLKGKKGISDITLATEIERLYLISTGSVFVNPQKFIDSSNMTKVVELIRKDYDVIILDCPAMEDGSDVAIASSYSDSVIFVAASGYISERSLKRAIEIVQKTETSILGVVLNRG
jgi:succinoglycan biosynthesis transport protein ExoP